MRPCAVIRAIFAAVDRGDLRGARALLADDFVKRSVVHEPGAPEPRTMLLSIDDYMGALVPLVEAFSEMDHGVRCRELGPGRCAGTFHVRARHTGTLHLSHRGIDLAPTGRSIGLPPEDFVAEVRDGRLAALEVDHPDGGGITGVLRQLRG